MLALRRRWAGLSILNKAIVLSCTFVIPILLVVGLLLNDFYAYRKESDRILSEYVLCTDYMDAVENEMSLLGEMTFAAPGSVELEDYADAVQNTSLVWERLRTTASAGGRDGEVLRQVIGRMMKSYRARQKIFLTGLRGGTFDADEYEQLRAQGEYLTQYADRLMDDFLMEGRDSYLNLGKRSSSQNIVFTIAAALGSVLFAAAMLYYARSLLLPVQQMSRGARRVAEGEYDMGDFHYARTDEIGMLADSFNHLKHQVARTIHALEGEAQLEKSLRHQESEAARLRQLIEQSRFAQLQSQINPHFLYNTLESITWMVEANRNTDAVFMISELAKLLRISLSKGRTVIRIADEIQHSTSYMNIQKVRYKERFATEFIIDEEINDYCTVKLIVQPILENAIYYGVGNMDEDDGGKITVRGEKKGDDIYISVEDNGMGMSEDVARNILVDNNKVPKHGSGVGVINVHSRIKLMFGSEYGLKVYSEPDEGTKVVIHIPAIPYTEENRERLERQDFGRGMATDEEE